MRRIELDGRPQDREELGRWYAAALKRQASSGLSVAEYADQIGVSAATLYQWRRRLSGEAVEKGRAGDLVGLVEVTVDREAVMDGTRGFLVRLGGERCIDVPAKFNDGELRRLVRVLESC
jgi:transposase-like protein